MQMLDRCSFLISEDRYLARCRVQVKENLCQDFDVCRCLELQGSTLPIQVLSFFLFHKKIFVKKSFHILSFAPPIFVGFVNKSSNDLLSQGNRASITERDSLDGVSVKLSRFFKFHDFKNFWHLTPLWPRWSINAEKRRRKACFGGFGAEECDHMSTLHASYFILAFHLYFCFALFSKWCLNHPLGQLLCRQLYTLMHAQCICQKNPLLYKFSG